MVSIKMTFEALISTSIPLSKAFLCSTLVYVVWPPFHECFDSKTQKYHQYISPCPPSWICLVWLETGPSGRHFERGRDSGNDVSIFGVLGREGRAVVLECLEN